MIQEILAGSIREFFSLRIQSGRSPKPAHTPRCSIPSSVFLRSTPQR